MTGLALTNDWAFIKLHYCGTKKIKLHWPKDRHLSIESPQIVGNKLNEERGRECTILTRHARLQQGKVCDWTRVWTAHSHHILTLYLIQQMGHWHTFYVWLLIVNLTAVMMMSDSLQKAVRRQTLSGTHTQNGNGQFNSKAVLLQWHEGAKGFQALRHMCHNHFWHTL